MENPESYINLTLSFRPHFTAGFLCVIRDRIQVSSMSPVPVYAGTLVRVVLAHAPQFKAVHGDEFFIKLAKLAYKFIYEEFCSWPVSSAQHPTGRNDFIYVNSCSDLVGDFFFLTLFLGLEVDNLDAMMAELEDYLIVNLTPHTDFELNLQVHRAQKAEEVYALFGY